MELNLQNFLQFVEDLPITQIGGAAAANGLNIPLDVAAAKGIVAAVVKDFFSGATATVAATPATGAAIAAHIASAS